MTHLAISRALVLLMVIALVALPCVKAQGPEFKKYQGEPKEVELPGIVADVAIGGHGRYLFLYLQGQRQIAIYDANATEIVKYLPVSTDDATIVAGASKLVIFDNDQQLIQRWGIGTWERESIQPFPFAGVFKTAALGYGSEGPMLVHWAVGTSALDQAKYEFIDLQTLAPVAGITPFRLNNSSYRDYVHIRASQNGSAFGLWATSHSPTGLETLVLTGTRAVQNRAHTSAGVLVPGPMGKVLYTGKGAYTMELQPIGDLKQSRSAMILPSTLSAFALRPDQESVSIIDVGSGNTIGRVPIKAIGSPSQRGWERHDFLVDKRYHFIVQGRQLVCIPYSNDRLFVIPCDVDAMIGKMEKPITYVTSVPPVSVTKGTQLSYQIAVSGAASEIEFELNAAPEGMTLSNEGLLTWQVPDSLSDDLVFVIITIKTPHEPFFHTLKLKVL